MARSIGRWAKLNKVKFTIAYLDDHKSVLRSVVFRGKQCLHFLYIDMPVVGRLAGGQDDNRVDKSAGDA